MNKNSAAQDAAIRHRDGPALIIAGPGSGKTYTIVRRLENLIINCQIRPSEILTITYTKEAAREMRSRAYSLVGECAKEAAFGTFHSVFYSILRNTFSLNASNILKRRDKYLILRDIAGKLNLETSDIPSVVMELSTLISRSKNGMDTKSALGEEIDRKAVTLYNEALKELRLIDFDDMIIKCRSLFERDPVCLKKWQERYRYIMVDEFQDTDPAQYDTIRLLAGERANLCVVGDDDQAIFGFRGADPQVLQRFLEDYPDAVKYELDINYRCHAPIADAADKVIEENSRRIKKHHSAFNLMGYKVDIRCFKDREKETDGIRKEINTDILGSYVILYLC